MKKLLGIVLSTALMANCVVSSALAVNENPIATYIDTEYFLVAGGTAVAISDYPLTVQQDNSDKSGTVVKMDTTVQDHITYSDYNITLSNLDSLQNSADKIATAEYVLKNVFQYNEEQIEFLTNEQKFNMAFAPKLNLQVVNYMQMKTALNSPILISN